MMVSMAEMEIVKLVMGIKMGFGLISVKRIAESVPDAELDDFADWLREVQERSGVEACKVGPWMCEQLSNGGCRFVHDDGEEIALDWEAIIDLGCAIDSRICPDCFISPLATVIQATPDNRKLRLLEYVKRSRLLSDSWARVSGWQISPAYDDELAYSTQYEESHIGALFEGYGIEETIYFKSKGVQKFIKALEASIPPNVVQTSLKDDLRSAPAALEKLADSISEVRSLLDSVDTANLSDMAISDRHREDLIDRIATVTEALDRLPIYSLVRLGRRIAALAQ